MTWYDVLQTSKDTVRRSFRVEARSKEEAIRQVERAEADQLNVETLEFDSSPEYLAVEDPNQEGSSELSPVRQHLSRLLAIAEQFQDRLSSKDLEWLKEAESFVEENPIG